MPAKKLHSRSRCRERERCTARGGRTRSRGAVWPLPSGSRTRRNAPSQSPSRRRACASASARRSEAGVADAVEVAAESRRGRVAQRRTGVGIPNSSVESAARRRSTRGLVRRHARTNIRARRTCMDGGERGTLPSLQEANENAHARGRVVSTRGRDADGRHRVGCASSRGGLAAALVRPPRARALALALSLLILRVWCALGGVE